MAKVTLTCTYCGKSWIEVVTRQSELVDICCTVCGDKNIIKNVIKTIDYYSDQKGEE